MTGYKPFDVVRLRCDRPDDGLTAGTRATILELWDDAEPAYEIEVVGAEGETLFTGAVPQDAVELEWSDPG